MSTSLIIHRALIYSLVIYVLLERMVVCNMPIDLFHSKSLTNIPQKLENKTRRTRWHR